MTSGGKMEQTTRVWFYSGYTHAERPKSFIWEGQVQEVEKVESAWRGPDEKCFRVRTKENRIFELCYRESEDKWSVIELLTP